MLVILFIFVLILCFGVMLYFLKPTAIEKAVAGQLADIENTGGTQLSASILKEEALRSDTLIDDLMSFVPWTPAVSRLIKQAGNDWQASTVVLLSSLAAIVCAWLAWAMSSNLLACLAAGGVVAAAPYVYLYVLREARRHKFDSLLPEAVDLMARGLRAGHSIAAVLEMVGNEIGDPIGTEFRALHKEQTLGLPMREAMMHLIERMPLDDLRFLATAILLQKESGGNLAQILDKTAMVIRERARLRGQLRIYTAQGRITGWIVGAAPFLMFALISTLNRNYEKKLFSTPFGLHMVYGGLTLMVIGILIIRKIVDVKV